MTLLVYQSITSLLRTQNSPCPEILNPSLGDLSPMAPMHRCLCTSYKCNEVIDAAGERGNLVDTRKYQNHHQADKNAVMHALAMQAQEAILEHQEESLSNAVKGILMMDPTTIPVAAMPLPDNDCYNIDRTCRMVAHISEVKAELA